MGQLKSRCFIVLIPKVKNPMSLAQFCPTGLCSVLYKCFSKILVSRLRPLLPKPVSKELETFIGGQSIFEHITLVRELLCSFTKKTRVILC